MNTHPFRTVHLPKNPSYEAPDGSNVRVLCQLEGSGSMTHFELLPGHTSTAVTHENVDKMWYILSGHGQMWRRAAKGLVVEEVTPLEPKVSLTIPKGTHFQFRCTGKDPLEAVGVTIPPWPGAKEAIVVEGIWQPTTTKSA